MNSFLICSSNKLRISAIADGVLHNEAFRHTGRERNLESWTNLLQEFKFFGEMDVHDHITFLRWRFVTGASEWLSGGHGSKQNDQNILGYTDQEWESIWSSMLEDGAWAMPSLKDNMGNHLKDNFAPELLIKFIAHDLKSHIIVFDLQLNSIQFCSGNHIKSDNVIFDSPLLLYATGSHFQAVFQKDHSFFIDLAKKLDIENNPSGNQMNPNQNHQAPISENIQKRSNSEDRNDFKKKKIENILSFSKQDNFEFEFESRLDEIKKIKAKDRSEELQREYKTLMKKRNRAKSNEETVKMENEKQKTRMAKAREDENFKAKENEKDKTRKAKKREDEQMRENENKKQKKRMTKAREDENFKAKENETDKASKAKKRKDEEMRAKENEKQKTRKAKEREDEERRKELNDSFKKARLKKSNKEREPFKLIAVNQDQADFKENDFPDELISSSIGSIL